MANSKIVYPVSVDNLRHESKQPTLSFRGLGTFEPAHDKIYNKTRVARKVGTACTSTKYGKDSHLSLCIARRLYKAHAIR